MMGIIGIVALFVFATMIVVALMAREQDAKEAQDRERQNRDN